MSSKTLYIIRGVPGSGKSTLAHQLSKTVVETDDFMMDDGEYKYDKDKVYACHKKCFNKVLDYMAHSVTPIAVANTFIKKKDYKPYVDLAKEFGYNVEIKVCKGDYKNIHNVPQDRVEQMKSKFQESINSLLEMNCDTGIETIIENKKKSLFEGYDFENITKLSKTSDGYDITAMGSKIGHIVAEMDSSNQLHIGYIEILPKYRQNGIATIALSLLKDELNPTSVIANITSIASLKAFCNAFGNPSYSSNVSGMRVSPSYGLPEYPTETTNTDGEYNTCMWKLSNTIRESFEPKLNDNFKKWFGNSKVVDENGNPLVVYHGSPNTFEIFDENHFGLNNIKGFWFSNDKKVGEHYKQKSGKLYSCYIRLENPYILKTPDMTDEERFKRTHIFRSDKNPRAKLACEDLKKEGYDGLLSKDDDGYIEVVAFYPNQIKSVNNNGNWSSDVDNINESKEVKFNDNFKKWFGNSKCVDENGNPKVFIHRSNAKFNTFDKSKIGQRDHGWYGKGFYFGSAKQKYYQLYGKHVYKCFLRIENPFYYNEFFGSSIPDDYQKIIGYDKLGILTPQESNFLKKYVEVYEHFNSNVKLKKVPQKVKEFNGKVYDSFYWIAQYNGKTTRTDAYINPRDNTEDYAKEMFWIEHYVKYIEKIKEINRNCSKTRMDKFSDTVRKMGYDGIIHGDEYVVFEPNQIKSVKNNGDWSLTADNINESIQPKLNDNFWKWFGNSKTIKNGKPIIYYHRTNTEFNIFSKDYNDGLLVSGFYFSEKPLSDWYGKNIKECYLKMENPYIIEDMDNIYDIEKFVKTFDLFKKKWQLKDIKSALKEYSEARCMDRTKKFDGKSALRSLVKWDFDDQTSKITSIVKNKGYDSLIFKNSNGKDGIVFDEYIVFEPNQIKSINNNGNWSLEVDNINEEKEVIEERLFPELSDRKYNELLWFTTPNMTANAYTKFFGKEMIADRIPAKYLVTLSSNDISLKDLVEKHRKLHNAKQVKPIADYKDFNDFITDLNKSKYLSRNDKSNIAKSGAKIIKSFGDWDLYDITSWEAAKKYGSGTTWCVTDSTSDDYFKRYTNRLPFNDDQSEEDWKRSKRSLLFLINPNTDRKMAISVLKRMDYDWYDDLIEFYDEGDEFFYTYCHTTEGSISLKDDIMEKISYCGDDWPDADVIEDYGVTEDFINSVNQFIKDMYRMNKEQIVEDINKLRQKYKQLMNIKESYNKLNKFGMNIKNVDSNICYKDGKGVVYNTLDEELVNENDMIYNIFYKDLPLLESEFLMMKDDDTRFGGVYDVNSGEVYYFPKNIVHNEDEIRKSLKDGIVKFSYYKINGKIVGGILAYDKTNAMKTIKYLEKQQKSFEPEHYMLELNNGKGYKYINVTASGKEVYENISRDYIGSRENIRKMVIESSHRLNDDNHNMTWEEFVEKVGRENEFDGSVVISKHNTSIIIRQSGRILVRRLGKKPFMKAYSNLKTFDEIYNMLVEKGFVEEQILTEAVNQHSLYHGCDLAYAVSMMIDNAMRGETIANINGKKYQGNSLTRSLQFAKDWQEERWDGHGDELNQFWVVLELNKERLKTKYKVLPYNYWEDYFGKDYEHTIDRNGYGDQYEEFVVGRINNLRNYLDDVYLSDECFDVEYAEIFAIVKRELELRGEDYSESDIEEALQQLGIHKPSPDDLNKTKINENYKKLSDDSGIVEVFSYNDIKGFVNRCKFGARGLLNNNNGKVYLADSFDLYHGDMVDELVDLGENITYDSIVRFMVYNDKFKALDSEYGEEYRYGNHSISILTNGDLYVLFKDYNFMNDSFENMLKLETMEDLEDEDDSDNSSWKLSENKEYEGLNRIAGFYWFDENKFQMLKRKPIGVDNLSDDDNEFDYYHLEKIDGLIEDNKARFGIEKLGKEIVCYIEAETKSKCLRAKKAILRKYPDIVFDRFELSWENNGFETLNEEIAFGKMVNDEMITILKNPTRNELKKNGINHARIVVDDYGNIYFGSAEKYSHAMIVHELERNNISDFEILGTGYDWGFDVFLYDQTTNTFYYRVDYITEEEEKEKLETAKDFLNTSYFNKSFGDFDIQITDREEPWEK